MFMGCMVKVEKQINIFDDIIHLIKLDKGNIKINNILMK